MVAGLVVLSSCGNKTSENGEKGILDSMFTSNNAPKCDDKEVTETVSSILLENRGTLIDGFGRNGVILNEKDIKIKNILTKNINEELKSCNCEGSLESHLSGMTTEGNVTYTAQKNSEGEIIVKVDDAGPFKLNFR